MASLFLALISSVLVLTNSSGHSFVKRFLLDMNSQCSSHDFHQITSMMQVWITYGCSEAVNDFYHSVTHNQNEEKRYDCLDSSVNYASVRHHSDTVHQAINSHNNKWYPDVHHVVSSAHHHDCTEEVLRWVENLIKTTTAKATTINAVTTMTTGGISTTSQSSVPVTNTNSANQCDQVTNKNHAIVLLNGLIRHTHFSVVEKLYLELALGFSEHTAIGRRHTRQTDVFTEYNNIKNYILGNMNEICQQDIYTWIEGTV
ncbi:uncharacterized protein [Mytilus edulis]|uniref:uncharacterized protein n=1 Tax=Mytilus edulis TaxID=6550 RepID=UPI0039EEB589